MKDPGNVEILVQEAWPGLPPVVMGPPPFAPILITLVDQPGGEALVVVQLNTVKPSPIAGATKMAPVTLMVLGSVKKYDVCESYKAACAKLERRDLVADETT